VNVEHEIKIFKKSANLQESDRFSLLPPQGRKQHESPRFCYFIIKNQKSKAKQEIKKSPNQGGQVNREDILIARTPTFKYLHLTSDDDNRFRNDRSVLIAGFSTQIEDNLWDKSIFTKDNNRLADCLKNRHFKEVVKKIRDKAKSILIPLLSVLERGFIFEVFFMVKIEIDAPAIDYGRF